MIPFPSWSMIPTSSWDEGYVKVNSTTVSPLFLFLWPSIQSLPWPEAFIPFVWYRWVLSRHYLAQVTGGDSAVTTDIKQSEHLLARTSSRHPSSHSLARGRVEIVSLSILHMSWILDAEGSLVILNLSLWQSLSGLGKKIIDWRRFNVQYRISWFSARLTALISSSLRFCSSI